MVPFEMITENKDDLILNLFHLKLSKKLITNKNHQINNTFQSKLSPKYFVELVLFFVFILFHSIS